MLYRRGSIWWYEFHFNSARIRESSRSTSKTVARNAQMKRHRELEAGTAGLRRREASLFRIAAKNWVDTKRGKLAPRTVAIEEANLVHVLPHFGGVLTSDVEAADVSRYQQRRLADGAAPKTVNLEVATVRGVLRRSGQWARIQPEVSMLRVREDVGRALAADEERKLTKACGASRSRALLPAVLVALNTGLRYGELVALRWEQIDLPGRRLTVGASKTDAGVGRPIPLNDRAFSALELWSARFPRRKPEHFVFPTEKYGQVGEKRDGVYDVDPTTPLLTLRVGWVLARSRAGVTCRWHDLRHTFCTRLLEGSVSFPMLAAIMGWSPATTARMAKRYGHVSMEAKKRAVAMLDAPVSEGDSPQNSPQSAEIAPHAAPN
jgi:integrase